MNNHHMFVLVLSILTLSSFTTSANVNNRCPIYTCDNTEQGKCSVKVDTTERVNFKVSECPKNQVCPFYSKDPVQCIDRPKTLKSFPGGPCQTNDDCALDATCESNICKNVADGADCTTHGQCNIGSSCYKGKCTAQSDVNGDCDSDYNCLNTLGCNNTNKCVPYYSIKKGDSYQMKEKVNIPGLSLCQTGFSTSKNICDILKFKDDKNDCTTSGECIYVDSQGTDYPIPELCQCGYDGKRYCQPFTGEGEEYNAFVQKKIETLKNKNCHTEERFECKDNVSDEKKLETTADYVTSVIKIFEQQKFNNLAEKDKQCVMNVVYPILKNSPTPVPPPVTDYCPAFTCTDDEAKHCVEEKTDDSKKVSFTLSRCAKDKVCIYDPLKLDKSSSDYNADCSDKKNRRDNSVFPGETCSADKECMKISLPDQTVLQKCTEGKCEGIKAKATCSSDNQCVSGTFCDTTTKLCTDQLDKDAKCTRSAECKNQFACNGNCVDFRTVPVGTKLAVNFTDDAQLALEAKYNCVTGRAFSDGVCGELLYKDASKATDGVVKCNVGEKCDYVFKFGDGKPEQSITMDCACGYNADGQGYCPYSTDKVNKDKEQKMFELFKSGSSCHTLNRLGCADIKKNKDYISQEAAGDVKFYKSPACAAEVLLGYTKSSLISVSLAMIGLVYVFLF